LTSFIIVIVCLTPQEEYNLNFPPRENLLACIKSILDTNGDGNITSQEITNAFSTTLSNQTTFSFLSDGINATFIMSHCDTNLDGILNLDDWNSPDFCFKDRNLALSSIIKQICDKV